MINKLLISFERAEIIDGLRDKSEEIGDSCVRLLRIMDNPTSSSTTSKVKQIALLILVLPLFPILISILYVSRKCSTSYQNNKYLYNKVNEKINKVIEDGLSVLDLSHCQLKALPENICQLKNLEIIYLNNNKLTQFPEILYHLCGSCNITNIDLRKNENGIENSEFYLKLDAKKCKVQFDAKSNENDNKSAISDPAFDAIVQKVEPVNTEVVSALWSKGPRSPASDDLFQEQLFGDDSFNGGAEKVVDGSIEAQEALIEAPRMEEECVHSLCSDFPPLEIDTSQSNENILHALDDPDQYLNQQECGVFMKNEKVRAKKEKARIQELKAQRDQMTEDSKHNGYFNNLNLIMPANPQQLDHWRTNEGPALVRSEVVRLVETIWGDLQSSSSSTIPSQENASPNALQATSSNVVERSCQTGGVKKKQRRPKIVDIAERSSGKLGAGGEGSSSLKAALEYFLTEKNISDRVVQTVEIIAREVAQFGKCQNCTLEPTLTHPQQRRFRSICLTDDDIQQLRALCTMKQVLPDRWRSAWKDISMRGVGHEATEQISQSLHKLCAACRHRGSV